jgi:repressor LexA
VFLEKILTFCKVFIISPFDPFTLHYANDIIETRLEVCNMLKIKEIRKPKGITAKELAEHVNVAESTMSLYENGKREPDFKTILKIAEYLEVSVDELFGLPRIGAKKGVKIPVLGSVAAGIPIEAITDIEDYEEITEELASTGEYVALRIKGNSMSPKIEDRDIVIIRIQDTIENGEIAIVIVDGDEATCKKIKKESEGITLIPFNIDQYEPKFYSNAEIEKLPVRIFGKVVELRRAIHF